VVEQRAHATRIRGSLLDHHERGLDAGGVELLEEGRDEQRRWGRGGSQALAAHRDGSAGRARCDRIVGGDVAHNLLYAEQIFGKDHVANRIRARRDPRQRGEPREPREPQEPQEPPANCELAASGLAKLGFSRAEVGRALAAVTARRPGAVLATTPVETIVREALAVLA
jgi:hypothetical protein